MGLLPRALLRLVVLVCLMSSAAQAAERVTVSGDVGRDSGRLEFNWPRAVLYDARVILGRLVVQFSEPGDFDFSGYRNAMPQYLGTPTVVANGSVIAFPLRVPVSVRHRQDGPLITIELHDETALPELSTAAGDDAAAEDSQDDGSAEAIAEDETDDGAPESLDAPPIETFAGPAGGPPLGLRIGEHPGFSRLVFDWPSDVAYRIAQRGDRLTLDFDAAAELDLSNYERNGLDNVYEISTQTGEAGLSVSLHLTEVWLVRHFRSGTFVVVDVVHDEARAQAVAAAEVVEAMPVSEPPTQLAAEPAPDAAPPASPAAPVSQEPLAASTQEPPESAPDSGDDGEPRMAAIEPSEPLPAPATPPLDDPEVEPLAGPEPGPTPDPLADALARGEGALSLAEVREVAHGDPAPADGAQVGARKPVLLRFDWPSSPGRAAAFRRGRNLWIVFDQPVAEGASRRIAENLPDLAPVLRLAAENAPAASVFRLNLPVGFVPVLRREERAWIVDLRPRADGPETALGLEYLSETPDPRIRFGVGGTAGVLSLRDPDLGDRLEIVPVPVAGQGLERPRHFLQFRALATYQGLALIPLSDGLAVETDDSGVVVRDAAGLLVSPGADRDRKLRDNNDFESG